jgi:F-type H+-transporting ATPase subunit epsilon
MAYSFRIDILTPDDTYFTGEVLSVLLPGTAGYLGILVNHAPLVTPLIKGRIELHLANRTRKAFAVDSGLFEVAYNQAIVLVEKITLLDLPASEYRI